MSAAQQPQGFVSSGDGATGPDQRDWREVRDTINLPLFPISIRLEGGKWMKRPLTPHGHKDAMWSPDAFGTLWERADGFGVPTGQVGSSYGLYAFDLDDYKDGGAKAEAWLKAHKAWTGTREHETVSGGRHLIYSLPNDSLNLPSRANIINGLDARGQGGWLAFGRGYRVIRDVSPHLLGKAAIAAIWSGYKGEARPDGVAFDQSEVAGLAGAYKASDGRSARDTFLALLKSSRTLAARINGDKGHGDASRSGIDFSVAHCLAFRMVDPNTIITILLDLVPNGQCNDPRLTPKLKLRAACRSTVKALAAVEAERKAREVAGLPKNTMTTDEYIAFMGL